MTRKVAAAIVKEGQRRSPRICALESNAAAAAAAAADNGSKNDCKRRRRRGQGGPAFQTRARKRTKLRPLQQLTTNNSPSSPNQEQEDVVTHSHHQAIQDKTDQQPNLPSTTFVPEKRILQLVLDTLQRRDTYEIFAEPVDSNEVENYYTIIEEPMDFGTMRAKLHEGMYKSLEQFEHDVFLIFNNAMHFNSAGTVYFRQARAISELAKKVFDLLRNDPEKFELEFSETRRKVGRRNQGDFRDSTDMKSNDIIGVPSKTVSSSSRGTLNRKSLKANHGCSDIAKPVDARNIEVQPGTKENSRYKSFEVDRRCTYRPLSIGEDDSIFPTVYGKLKQLEYVNQQEVVGYRDSLMLFVKDLGPTVQNIAKRKLLGCEIRTASTSTPCRPNTFSTATELMSQYPPLNRFPNHSNEMRSTRETIDLSGGEPSYINDKTDNVKLVGGTLNADKEKGCSPLEGNAQGNHKWSFRCNKVFSDPCFYSDSYYSRACADDLNCSDHGPKETDKKSMTMLFDKSKLVNQEQLSVPNLENFQANNVLVSGLENKCKIQSLPWPFENSDFSCFAQDKSQMPKSNSECVIGYRGNIEAQGPTNEISWSSEAMKKLKSDQSVPLASSFVFNLPYLKTRLDQINSSEQKRFLQKESSVKNSPFSGEVSNYQGFLTSNPPTTLCTSLYSHNNPQH